MKRMFLASSFADVADLFVKFIDGRCEGKTITFIPTASLPEDVKFYVAAAKEALEKMGLIVDELEISTATKKEMVTMYHCKDVACSEVKATHYCVKQNQPEMLVDISSTSTRLIYNCDMSTELCQSKQNHVHKITHELSNNGSHLKTTYTSFDDGRYLKDSIYHFDRK